MKDISESTPMRPVIVTTLAVLLGLAILPWYSGGQEGMIRFIVGGIILLAAILAWRQPEIRKLKFGPLTWSYAAFVGWTALSLFWTVNRYETIMWLAQIVLAGVVFRLAYAIADERKGRLHLETFYLLGAVVFAIYGLYLYFTGAYDRLTGWFYWANPAAAFLIPALVLSWARLRGKWYGIWLAASILLSAAFFLTDSRGATLVLVLLLVPTILLQSHNKLSRTLLVFSLIFGFGLSLGCVQLRHKFAHNGSVSAPGSRFAEAAAGESRSVKDRINYLKSATDIWYNHPLLGTGGGTFGTVHPQYQRTVVSASTSAHNIYVQTLAEEGIIGGTLLAGVIFVLVFGFLRSIWREPAKVGVAIGAIALLVHFGLDIDVRYPALVFLAAALAGLAYRQSGEAYSKLTLLVPGLTLGAFIVLMGGFQSGVAYNRGLSVQADGDYPAAATWFQQAHNGLTYDPDTINAEGIDYYSEAIINAPGALVLALDRAKTAIAQDPEDSQHYQLEGRVLRLQKDRAGAEQAFRTALIKDPYNHPDYSSDLALVLIAGGKNNEALVAVQSMLAQYPLSVVTNRSADKTLLNNLANLSGIEAQLYINKGELGAAKKAVAQGLKLNPQNLRCRSLDNLLRGK